MQAPTTDEKHCLFGGHLDLCERERCECPCHTPGSIDDMLGFIAAEKTTTVLEAQNIGCIPQRKVSE